MTEITNSTVLKFNKDVVKRYEHNLDGGTMILCNMKNFEFWFGNESSGDLIKLINGESSLEEIYTEILSQYDTEDYESVTEAYNNIIEDLFEKHFIEITEND